MKKLSYILLAATIVAGGGVAAAPAFAATSSGVLSCDAGNSADLLSSAKHELAAQLQLRTKSTPTIDEWNGCLKVQYTDANGHTNTALYDPDSLKLVNQLS
ncbi:MAG: hypothetical protein ABI398_00125 [Devosia sp.]